MLKNRKYLFIVRFIDLIGSLLFSLSGGKNFPEKPEKILLIRLDHIGDMLFTTPLLKKLRKKFPEAQIDLLIAPWGEEVFRGNTNFNNLIILKSGWFQRGEKKIFSISEIFKLILRLRKDRYDAAIDPRGDFRTIVLMLMSGAKFKSGYGITGGGFLLDKNLEYEKGIHEVEKNLKTLETFGFDYRTEKKTSLDLTITENDYEYVDNMLKQNKISNTDRFICISMNAGSPSRKWQDDKFKKLITKINKNTLFKIILIGTKGEREGLTCFINNLGFNPLNFAGFTNISQLAALLKKADLLIACNSGAIHIAAAVSAPSVILFSGTNDPAVWGPYNSESIIIRKEINCFPCEMRECQLQGHPCMEKITVDEVYKSLLNAGVTEVIQ